MKCQNHWISPKCTRHSDIFVRGNTCSTAEIQPDSKSDWTLNGSRQSAGKTCFFLYRSHNQLRNRTYVCFVFFMRSAIAIGVNRTALSFLIVAFIIYSCSNGNCFETLNVQFILGIEEISHFRLDGIIFRTLNCISTWIFIQKYKPEVRFPF